MASRQSAPGRPRASRLSTATTPRRKVGATNKTLTTPLSARVNGSSRLFSARKSSTTASCFSATRSRQPSEPRPISDKAYIRGSVTKLSEYLRSSGLSTSCSSSRALARPTSRDFEEVSSFLFGQIDLNWKRSEKKFEDEFVAMFKLLRYPFPISKTALVAVGTSHTWPPLLAALLWLVDLIQHDRANVKKQASASVSSLAQGETQQKSEGVFFYEFVGEAYSLFLSGDDDAYGELQGRLELAFEDRRKQAEREERAGEARTRDLDSRLAALRYAAERLPESLETKAELRAASIREHDGGDDGEDETAGAVASLARAQLDLTAMRGKTRELTVERERFETDAEDVSELRKREDQLLGLLVTLREAKTRAVDRRTAAEDTLRKSHLDPLAAMTRDYATRAATLQLLPMEAKNANGRDLSLGSINVTDKVTAVLEEASAAAKRAARVKPALSELADALRARAFDVRTEVSQVEVEHESLEARLAELRDELDLHNRDLAEKSDRYNQALERSHALSDASKRDAETLADDLAKTAEVASQEARKVAQQERTIQDLKDAHAADFERRRATRNERRTELEKAAEASITLADEGKRAAEVVQTQIAEAREIVRDCARSFASSSSTSASLASSSSAAPGSKSPMKDTSNHVSNQLIAKAHLL